MRRPWLDIRSGFDARIGQFDAATLAAVASWNKSLQTAKTEIAAADVDEAASVRISDAYKIPSGEITVRKGDTLLLVVSPKGNHGADSTRVRLDIAEVVGDAGGEARTWRLEDLAADFARGNPHPGVTEAGEQWSFLDMKAEPAFLGERIDGYQGQSAITIWQRGETPSAFANTSDQPITVWTELPPKSVFVHPGPEGPVAVAWTSPIDGVITVDGEVADAHPAPGLDGVAFSLLHIASPDSGAALAEIARLTSERATEIANRDRVSGPEPVVPVAFAVVDAEPRTTRVHLQGDPEKPGAEVPRRWIKILGGAPVEDTSSSGRAELADWIAGHPIATRVLVNRVWQQHFGKGIVASVNDFGSRGQPPTHPELLERLCEQFVADGRRLKPLHRMIMLSAAYQRSSDADADAIGRDPGNQWLSRFDRRRLSAEELRDSLLSVSGRLDRQPGGAHPFPKPETWGYTQHGPFNAVYDDSRRTVYQMVQRQRRHPFLALFDGADPNASTGTRQTTTVPTQALYFLNDPFFHAQSEAVAGIVMQSDGEGARFGRLMAITLQRAPLAGEPEYAIDFMARYPGDESQKWAALARLILAGNEFLHID
jgi:hypothetical protein